jgi:hypothetical protein
VPRLVIKTHRPWQVVTTIIVLSSVVALVTWLLLDSSHWQVINDRIRGSQDTKYLLETNEELLAHNKALQDQVLMFEQTTRLDKETAVLVQQDLKSLQDEISRLKRELEFYQVVMDTARNSTGIDVHGLHIEPFMRENQYQLKLVLTNVTKSDRVSKGTVTISVEGMQDRNKVILRLDDLSSIEPADFSFELKSFKGLDYRFELPADFIPQQVLVQINPQGEPVFNKIFDWPLKN